ncbi:MAG: archease [Acidobacteria bacterium]|nr:archease [Acidobacteriota bacterium]
MAGLRFRTLPHTADVRLQAWGVDATELILNVVLGAQAVALGRPPRGVAIAWVGIDRWPQGTERRAVRAANEALFHLFAHRRATVALELGDGGARLGLVPLPARTHLHCEIKAVTLHGLRPPRAGRRLGLVLTLDL